MNMKKNLTIAIFTLGFFNTYTHAENRAQDYELLSMVGTEEHPLILDLESSRKNISVISHDQSDFGFLEIKNVNPFHRNDYSIRLNQVLMLPVAFDKPEQKSIKSTDQAGRSPAAAMPADDCQNMSDIKKLFDGKVSEAITILEKRDDQAYPGCDEQIEKLIRDSKIYLKFQVAHGVNTSIEVTHNNEAYTAEIGVKPVEWVTHVGFTFAANKNNKFYSKETKDTPVQYEIAEQEKRSNIDYGATILFTYPMASWKSLQFGPTAGLASDASTIAVVFGGSIILNHNVVITLGIEAKQFEELNGLYTEGQNVGEKAVDSSILNEKQFKFAPMISIGYKFK